MELADDVYDRILELSEKGDVLAESEQFSAALIEYQQALDLLPSPKLDWEAATWLYTAMGDAYFSLEDLPNAMDAYQQALKAPDGIGNPYIWFCIGQVYFGWEQLDKAKEHFMRAYMLDGEDIFEDQPSEYFELIRGEISNR
ncbi:Tetratricopeptide repeat-containing protein [Chitinophaga jiangningensis]|uniref:Tetratricopeptide repeat-containing protein n=1 Tax=Chitinophaga jiangningensis TaxID=1419482 RepID=A0A1M6YSG7_9BACT|nr:tetratricopeptide repeat protein [Chitinophaga jiangningensis]SHL21045.1 Tetratricopeptide repeat-containing protein [Chitinophaga jiangningensis]